MCVPYAVHVGPKLSLHFNPDAGAAGRRGCGPRASPASTGPRAAPLSLSRGVQATYRVAARFQGLEGHSSFFKSAQLQVSVAPFLLQTGKESKVPSPGGVCPGAGRESSAPAVGSGGGCTVRSQVWCRLSLRFHWSWFSTELSSQTGVNRWFSLDCFEQK